MARVSESEKQRREEEERKRVLEWKRSLHDFIMEKHPKLLLLPKERIAVLQNRAIFLNYIQGEGKKLISHSPIQFTEKGL